MSRDWRTHEWEDETEQHFAALMTSVGRLMECGMMHTPLALAARLVETAAYEAARSEDPCQVSRMILMAADLEALAAQYPRRIVQTN